MKKWVGVILGVVCLGISSLAAAADFQVNNSFGLQAVLFLAQSNGQNDTVTLAAGDYSTTFVGTFNYVPIENRSLTVIGAGPDATILDGGGNDQVFSIDTTGLAADSDADITFQGVSIHNGNSSSVGAGLSILTNDADVRIEDCDFQSNETSFVGSSGAGGGGLFAWAMDAGSVFVTHSQFSKNTSPQASGAGSFITAVQGDVVLEGNTYVDNSAIPPGGSAETFGGGAVVVAIDGGAIVNGNIFFNNFAGSGGGGFNAIIVNGTGLITNNIIARNLIFTTSSPIDPFQVGGGGLSLVVPLGSVALTNNTITENRATGAPAGGLFVYQAVTGAAMVTTANNIIWGNSAAPGSLCADSCNDIRVNDDIDFDNKGASFTISHSDFSDISFQCDPVHNPSCVPDQHVDPATNLDKNPEFVSSVQDDFHLADTSPLIDKGDPLAPGLPPEDFDGEARNQGAAPDMGAFESAINTGGGGGSGGDGGGGTGGGAEGEGGGGGGCTLMTRPSNAALIPCVATGLFLAGLSVFTRRRAVKNQRVYLRE